MIYYRVIVSNKEGNFTIGEDELEKLIAAVQRQTPAVFRHGVLLNPNMGVSVIVDKDRAEEIGQLKKYGEEYVEKPSPFAKLLDRKPRTLSSPADKNPATQKKVTPLSDRNATGGARRAEDEKIRLAHEGPAYQRLRDAARSLRAGEPYTKDGVKRV